MKAFSYILTFFFLTSCFEPRVKKVSDNIPVESDTATKQLSPNDRTPKESELDKTDMSYVNYWCTTDILRKTEKNIDNLDIALIADFLATFHASCNDNAEYSEWSNELLFKVIGKKPNRFLELISKNSSLSREHIIEELKSPIHEQADLDSIAIEIERLEIPNSEEWKSKIILSLEIAKK